jgi:hypothetical protein
MKGSFEVGGEPPDYDALNKRMADADAKAATLSEARNKPLEEMTDEEVLHNFNPTGFGWDVPPQSPDQDAYEKSQKIWERLKQIEAKRKSQ